MDVRALVAPSFSDIFARNAAKNGLIPAAVPLGALDRLLAAATLGELTVDLVACSVGLPTIIIDFSIDAYQRQCLLDGIGDIDRTLADAGQLPEHEARLEVEQQWV